MGCQECKRHQGVETIHAQEHRSDEVLRARRADTVSDRHVRRGSLADWPEGDSFQDQRRGCRVRQPVVRVLEQGAAHHADREDVEDEDGETTTVDKEDECYEYVPKLPKVQAAKKVMPKKKVAKKKVVKKKVVKKKVVKKK